MIPALPLVSAASNRLLIGITPRKFKASPTLTTHDRLIWSRLAGARHQQEPENDENRTQVLRTLGWVAAPPKPR